MAGLRAPKPAPGPVPVFRSGELSALRQSCQGRSFEARRDAAIIEVLLAAGIRLSELAGIGYDPDYPARSDLRLLDREIRVRGKAGRERIVRIGFEAAFGEPDILVNCAASRCRPTTGPRRAVKDPRRCCAPRVGGSR